MATAPKEILVIDDDPQILLVMNKILSSAGYRVLEAESVSQALELLQKRIPHLVITDLKLKDESGFDYLEKHRKLKGMKNVPVIVLSGVRAREAVYQAISLGAIDYVAKPIDSAALIPKIKKALKDRKFPHYTLPEEKKEIVHLRAPAKIIQANEIGFLLEAPVRIADNTRVDISSALLRQLGCETCIFQRTQLPARPGFPGQYLNDIAIIGLAASHVARIREIVGNWK